MAIDICPHGGPAVRGLDGRRRPGGEGSDRSAGAGSSEKRMTAAQEAFVRLPLFEYMPVEKGPSRPWPRSGRDPTTRSVPNL